MDWEMIKIIDGVINKNVGAFMVINRLMNECDNQDIVDILHWCRDTGTVGDKLWILYKDKCGMVLEVMVDYVLSQRVVTGYLNFNVSKN